MKLFESLISNKFELIVDPELGFDKNKMKTSKKFLNFCCDELELTDKFVCQIVNDRKSNGIVTTAYYAPSEKKIVVYGKNRMLGDILRSVAHEIVHFHQDINGRINGEVQDIGGELEDEGNAKAGYLVKKFIKHDELGENLFEWAM